MGSPRSLIAIVVICLACPRAVSAEPSGWDYVRAGSELEWVARVGPLPTHQLGAAAVALADNRPLPQVLGDPAAVVPPVGWPAGALGGARGKTPLGGADDKGRCSCNTLIGDTARERVAVVYATTEFSIGDELGDVSVLVLDATYRDGMVAYINGVEVARRNLPRDAPPMATAARMRGNQSEAFFIPVTPGLLRKGKNRLSIAVRPSAHRLTPHLDVSMRGRQGSLVVRGPIVQRVTPTSATLVFETDLPVRAAVTYKRGDTSREVPSAGGGLAMRHVVELKDLPAGKPVRYQLRVGGWKSAIHTFHTAVTRDESVRFVVYGDTRDRHAVHARIVAALVKEAPDFVIATGDLVARGSDEADWQRFFEIVGELVATIPFYTVVGNHDAGRSGDEERRVNEIFALWPGPENRPEWGHWYSFDVSGIHFAMIDSNAYQYAAQLAWLEQDLAAAVARGVRASFAVVHAGPYSRGPHGGNAYAAEHYAPLLAKHGVTLLFSGHEHMYQRGEVNGLGYIVSGGGGAWLYKPRCGVRGKKRCKVDDGMKYVASEHHYVVVTIQGESATACPKRPDRTAVEACTTYRLPTRSK